jgi:hypothetical protein
MPLVPTDNALLKGAIIKKTGRVKKVFELCLLGLVGKKPVFESLAHLFAPLRLNVAPNCYFTDMPNAASIVAATPKRGQFAAQFWKFLAQDSAGITLQSVRNFGNRTGWVMFKKQMYVIWHYLQSVDRKFKLGGFFTKKLLKSVRNRFSQHTTTIFRAPNKMQLQAENSSGIFGVSVHVYNIYTPNVYVNNNLTERRAGHSSAT